MRVGFSAIHRRPSPSVAARVGMAGLGDVNAQLQAWLSSLGGESGVDAAVGCGPSGGAPCGSPEAAAQMAVTIARQACVQESYDADFPGYVADPLCADGGTAAGQAFASQALAYFNSLPASVWTKEAQNAAAGAPYGSVNGSDYGGLCPSGIQGPNGTCVGTPTPIPFSITTGAPAITSAPPPSSPAPSQSSAPSAPSAPSSAPGTTTGGTSSGTTGGTATDPFAWLTATAISGIPNWWLLAGGVAAVVVLPMILKRFK